MLIRIHFQKHVANSIGTALNKMPRYCFHINPHCCSDCGEGQLDPNNEAPGAAAAAAGDRLRLHRTIGEAPLPSPPPPLYFVPGRA